MTIKRSGTYQSQGDYKAFIPSELPPSPSVVIEGELKEALDDANPMLTRLDELGSSLPNIDLFVAMHVRKEALLSAQIEGTQASLEDIFNVESNVEVPNITEVTEVINYIKALHYGAKKLDSLPMSLRLIKELHTLLLEDTSGNTKSPGEFRRSQNWIGYTLFTASYVPPPPHMVTELMGSLEKYLHSDSSLPPLIDCALIHYQLETIHPFLDSNGRLGRLLITFYLQWKNILPSPLLYVSYYLKLHRQEYYDRLTMVRTTGNYEQWILFFLKGVSVTCVSALKTIREILSLQEEMRSFLFKNNASISAMKLMHHLYYVPVIRISDVQKVCEVSFQGASNTVKEFEAWGILKEVTGKKRSKRYAFKRYIKMLSKGAEPL